MRFKELQHTRKHIHAPPAGPDVPGLMIDAGADDIHIPQRDALVGPDHALALRPQLNALGDLLVPVLHAVA